MTQTLAPVRMRAMASALLLFVLNIIGLGMGPQAVGIMSDLLAPALGHESLRYALLISSSFYIWSAYHFWRRRNTARRSETGGGMKTIIGGNMTSIDEDGAATAALIPEHAPAAHFSKPYIRYVIGILTMVYAVNLIDRQILSILMQPIKMEMQLSDTALGFLSGIAFALFYAVLGIPIARLADKTSRVNIISISVALWSFMTALCGLAQNFWQLLASRILVGVGEAGSGPSSHSLIADYVPLETRSSALAIYSLGIPIGIMIGFSLGGWLEQLYGWRVAFMAVGLPGLALGGDCPTDPA